jgi:hypothetical protein
MNTLREIGEFIGMSPGTRLRSASDLVISAGEQISMREVIQRLPNLPPISLEAEAVGDRFGEVPFTPVFRVHPSQGVVLGTRIILFANGRQPDESAEVGDSGDFNPITLRIPGIFFMQVRRTGVTGTGVTVLTKDFHVEGVAVPSPPPPQPPPIVPPFISVKSIGDGTFTLSGKDFERNATVTIRVVAEDHPLEPNANLFLVTTATPEGKVEDFPTGKICLVPGTRLSFSAEDGRIDPANHGAITSNFVKLSCPFPK